VISKLLFHNFSNLIAGSLPSWNGCHYSRSDEWRRSPHCVFGSCEGIGRPEAQLRNTTYLSLGNHYSQNFNCALFGAHCAEQVLQETFVGNHRLLIHLYRSMLHDYRASMQEFGHPLGLRRQDHMLDTKYTKRSKLYKCRSVTYPSSLPYLYPCQTLLIPPSSKYHHGFTSRRFACTHAMECPNKPSNKGISDLHHGPRSLVRFHHILAAWCVLLNIFSSACAAAMVKTSYIVNYGKTGDFLWDSANLTIWIV
jgi:hypothetical protein